MKHIFFFILTALAIFGCDNSQKEANRSIFCYVRYDASNKSIKAEATMNDEDQKKPVEWPGGIRYQRMEMQLLPVYGMTYRYEYNAAFLPDHVFEWTEAQNHKSAFHMSIDPIQAFSLPAAAISKSKPTSVKWEGSPLGKGETLVFMWENQKEGKTLPLEVSSTSNVPVIDIPSAKIKELSPGTWTLYLVRKRLIKEKVGSIQANGIMEYYTEPISVRITE